MDICFAILDIFFAFAIAYQIFTDSQITEKYLHAAVAKWDKIFQFRQTSKEPPKALAGI